MIFLLIVTEIFLGLTLTRFFGFFGAFLVYFLPTVLGLPLLAFNNQMIWMQFRRQLALGRPPDQELMGLVAKFVGVILILVPSQICRILALLLLFPLTRLLVILLTKGWFAKKVTEGNFKIFNASTGFGSGNARFYYRDFSGAGSEGAPERDVRVERDAKVIDIEPLKLPEPEKGRKN